MEVLIGQKKLVVVIQLLARLVYFHIGHDLFILMGQSVVNWYVAV